MEDSVINLLLGYAARERKSHVDYEEFIKYAESYGYNNNLTELIRKIRDHKIEIIPTLMQWEYKGHCTLVRKENNVTGIIIHQLIIELLNKYYQQIEQNPEIPFPDDKYFGYSLPGKIVYLLDVQNEFVEYLANLDKKTPSLVKMTFPYEVSNLIVPRDIVKTRLIECCMSKLSRYLQYKMNIGYMHNRLENILSGNFEAIKKMLTEIQTKPRQAVQMIIEPDDFTYRFFSQFTSIIVKDFRDKKNKHQDEHGFVQSAQIIAFFTGYQKSLLQREQQRRLDEAQLEKQICKPPYAFSLLDFFEMKDSKGSRYIEKYSKDFIYDFLRKFTKPQSPNSLPELIVLKVKDHDYFIHKDYVIVLFLNILKEASSNLYREYLNEWQTLLKNNTRIPSMRNNEDFLMELTFKMQNRYPLFQPLCNLPLLLTLKNEANIPDQQKAILAECFSANNTLKPLDELLDLKRENLFSAVNTLLPVWYTWPILKHIFFLFKWLLGKSNRGFKSKALKLWKEAKTDSKSDLHEEYNKLLKEEEEKKNTSLPADSSTRKKIIAKYKNQIEKIKAELIGPKTDLNELLERLKEKWNPLFDPQAKENLIEDVNCLIRDYLRRIKKSFKIKSPTASLIREHANLLVANKNLSSIKKKEALRSYIEAYLLKLLAEMYNIKL